MVLSWLQIFNMEKNMSVISKTLTLLSTALLTLPLALSANAAELPAFKTGFIFTTHHAPFMIAAAKGEGFKEQGVYLKPLVPRESYELVVSDKNGDRPVAVLDLVVAKSGAETATLFAQKHMDLGIASITAIMAGVDKGTPMKIVCPMQTEGMALVAPVKSSLKDWDSLAERIKSAKEPVRIGFHSPTSAPKIVLEGALTKAGFKVTLNPSDQTAQVLLVDLKETSNLLAALSAGQVDAVVGPSPFPEVAQTRGVGKVVVELGKMPPQGEWANFPCCVAVASEDIMAKHPDVVRAFVELLTRSNAWCNAHPQEAGALAAAWIGLPEEAGRKSTLVFVNDFNESWMRGASAYLDILNGMNKFSGSLKGKKITEAAPLMIDASYVKAAK